MLDATFDDAYTRFGGGVPTFVDSSDLSRAERNKLWQEIMVAGREPDWGSDPRFVVATEYGGHWRKIMIVDSRHTIATFRSCTTNSTYRPALIIRAATWRMDNAMMDASTEIMRRFHTVLESLSS